MAASPIALIEGDIVVSDAPTARAITLSAASQLWPAGIVPYTIDPAIADSGVTAIMAAIDKWNEVGGISLLPMADVVELVSAPVNDFVHFVSGEYCASWVGRRGGKQDVWIAPYCPAGSVMHEIGHLLGLEHEHTRPDRDQYIRINWDNIELDKRHNFDVAPSGSKMLGEYDYDSIMHYGSHNFSSNGAATITPIESSSRGIGQRNAPSVGDLLAIAELYGSDLSLVTRSASTAQGLEFDLYVSNESSQGAHNVIVTIDVPGASATTTAGQEAWACETGSEKHALLCRLAILPGSSTALLHVGLPGSVDPNEVIISLRSKTPDQDMSNNDREVPGDDGEEIPDLKSAVDVVSAINDEALLQEDALARVAMSGGGAISAYAMLLLLFIRQAGRRVNFRLARCFVCQSRPRWLQREGSV
ncbi:MAG: M12 family metallopeptidase [Granulosicoccus sp.]